MLYFLSHENEKFVWELNCLRFILSHEGMFSKYDDLWLSFVLKVSHGLKECFDKKKTIVLVKKHIFWYYFWNPFIPCLHTFNCCASCIRFYVKEKALPHFLNVTLLIFPDFFLNAITEDMVLTNAIPLFVHYHGIVHRNKHKDIMKKKKKKIGVFY